LGHPRGAELRVARRASLASKFVSPRASIVALFTLFATITAPFISTIGAQNSVVTGRVLARGTGIPLGYAVVAASQGSRELFANADGLYTFRGLNAASVRFTAKRIGYMPFDTTIVVGARDTIHFDITLSLVAVELPAIHTFADGCVHPGAVPKSYGLELAVLFEQMQQNAERNRLFSREYPFEMLFERRLTRPEPALEARFIAFDTVVRSGARAWRYAPGKMLGTREYEPGIFGGKWTTLTLPELPDYADQVFLDNHCFDYSGIELVNGDSLIRIDFQPNPAIRSPDVAGVILLDSKTYQLRSTLVPLVNLTKSMQKQIGGQSVHVQFKELVPGVPVIDYLSSMIYPVAHHDSLSGEPATEDQRALRVQFLKGKPK
jgi:hypothetical protein